MSGFTCLGCDECACDDIGRYNADHPPHRRLFSGRRIVRCRSCALMQIHPVPDPEALADFYRRDYRRGGFNAAVDSTRFPWDCRNRVSRGRSLRRLAERHFDLTDEARVLEIGAGFGHNLAAFRETRPRCRLFASEADPSCRVTLAKIEGVRIGGDWSVPDDRRAMTSLGPFEMVLLVHVLEHPADPSGFLRSVRSALAPGGVVVLEVPSESPRLVRTSNNAPHICFFEIPSLARFLEAQGGRVLALETCGPRLTPPRSHLKRLVLATAPAWFIRRASRRKAAASSRTALAPAEIADRDLVPIAYYDEYGGERTWLRAVVAFG